jgi:hypothetical protein
MTAAEERYATGRYLCACQPARLCRPCEQRGYKSALAGYAARIWPAQCTPADEAREARAHYVDPDDDALRAYDTCANCGQAVTDHWASGELVTMTTGNAECYGNRYRPAH